MYKTQPDAPSPVEPEHQRFPRNAVTLVLSAIVGVVVTAIFQRPLDTMLWGQPGDGGPMTSFTEHVVSWFVAATLVGLVFLGGFATGWLSKPDLEERLRMWRQLLLRRYSLQPGRAMYPDRIEPQAVRLTHPHQYMNQLLYDNIIDTAKEKMRETHGHSDDVGLEECRLYGLSFNDKLCFVCGKPRFQPQERRNGE